MNQPQSFRMITKWNKWLLFVSTIIMVCLLSESVQAQTERGETLDKNTVKKLAKYLLRPPVRISPPSFIIKEGTLYYYVGNVLLSDTIPVSATESIPPSLNDPIAIVLKDQLQIELLRQYIIPPENSDFAFLDEGLDAADRVISQELIDIQNHRGTREELLRKLAIRRVEINNIIDSEIVSYATKNRLNWYKAIRKVLAASVQVTFSTIPVGGVVFYAPAFDWKVAVTAGKTPTWLLAAQSNPIPLNSGSYRIRIIWADAGSAGPPKESEYTIDIMNDGNLNLRQLRQP